MLEIQGNVDHRLQVTCINARDLENARILVVIDDSSARIFRRRFRASAIIVQLAISLF